MVVPEVAVVVFAHSQAAAEVWLNVVVFVPFASVRLPVAFWRLFQITPLTRAAWTKAVVASCVVFVPLVAVGAAGVPVNVGLASGARLESKVPESCTFPEPSVVTTSPEGAP